LLIAALLLGLQAVGPVLPFGVNASTHQAFLETQAALSQGNLASAKAWSAKLPYREVPYEWDNSLGDDAAEARDRAMEAWIGGVPGLKFKPVAKGGLLKFVFAEQSAGATFTFADAPRLTVSIARRRNGESIRQAVIYNEVAFGIGTYLGLAPTPLFGHFMGRTEVNTARRTLLQSRESMIARDTLGAVASLRQLVQAGQKVLPATPKLEMANAALGQAEVTQGAKLAYQVSVKNVGNAPLAIQASPDCGCVTVTPRTDLKPGQTGTLEVTIDTTEQRGKFRHRLIILSNDGARSSETIPLELDIKPRYRVVSPAGSLALLDTPQDRYEVLFWWNGDPLEVTEATIEGFDATVEYGPWEGESADPDLDEPSRARTGYRFRITPEGDVAPGRNPATLFLKTSHKDFSEIRFSFFVQRGIASLPPQVSFGLSSGERSGKVVLSRPGKPFKVLSVTSDSSFVFAKADEEGSLAEHKLTIRYDGKAPSGDLTAIVSITTDDETQKVIRIPVRVSVP